MALELAQDLGQLRGGVGHPVAELGEVARRAHAGDDVLALGVEEEVAGGLGRAGQLVAAEGHARAGRLAQVAVDHLLDVDRRAPVVGDAVDAPVGHRAVAHPGVEDGADRLLELLARVAGEVVERLEARVSSRRAAVSSSVSSVTPRSRLIRAISSSKRSPGTPRTTLPNICTSRR